MYIEQLHIQNYKVFKAAKIGGLSDLCVFLGANGSGKSTLFEIFEFLNDALLNNATIAINRLGGIKEVISRGCDSNRDAIQFELVFRGSDDQGAFNLIYTLAIGFRQGQATIEREILKRQAQGGEVCLLDFKFGSGVVVALSSNGAPHNSLQEEAHKLSSPDILAIKGLGQFERFAAIAELRVFLEQWHVSKFSVDAARHVFENGENRHLSATGHNLAQVTKYLYEHHPSIFEQILELLPQRIPGLRQVRAMESVEGRVVLQFQDGNFVDPFAGKFVSDGTLKLFAYMVLLYDPAPRPLLCLEEPEHFLHPDLLLELAEEIRAYAERGGQVFVSTHSPDFVNALKIEELYLLLKKEGFSQISAAKDNAIAKALYEAGNQLGWLWRNHYIKEANQL